MFIVLLAGACGRVPDYAIPAIAEAGELPTEGIGYRRLNITDFRAPSLPDSLRNHRPLLNAHTAIAIRTEPGVSFSLFPSVHDESQRACGRLLNLRFTAVMLPDESWWRSDLAPEKKAYVLQHEQIHFALMEIAARRLTRRSEVERNRLTSCAEGQAEVMGHLSAVVNRWLAESRTEVLREHTLFDEETSGRIAPDVQQRWGEKVHRSLSDLESWSSHRREDNRYLDKKNPDRAVGGLPPSRDNQRLRQEKGGRAGD